jgi:hypothetical protein
MATLKIKARSPFWYVQFKDVSGKWKTKATKYRRDNPRETKEARMRVKENTLEERLARKITPDEKWENWVPQFFNLHCSKLTNTKESYGISWTWLNSFFVEKGILTAAQVNYQAVVNFINWRIESCGVMKSTALKDRKVLRVIMQEAVRRGHATKNPCLRMGIPNDEVEPAPEFTSDQIKRIYAMLPKKEADWRYVSFRIALETGTRLAATQIEFKHIDFEKKTIEFPRPKGGYAKAFTCPLPESLIPMLLKIKQTGAPVTCVLPSNASQLINSKIIKKAASKQHSFKCTRVSFVTECHRAGIPLAACMKLANHSNEMVHKIYQRLSVADVQQYANRIRFVQPE